NFKLFLAGRHSNDDYIAFSLANQRFADRAGNGDSVQPDIGFSIADDLISHVTAGVQVFNADRCAKYNAPIDIQTGRLDDLRVGQETFQFIDAAFDKTLT